MKVSIELFNGKDWKPHINLESHDIVFESGFLKGVKKSKNGFAVKIDWIYKIQSGERVRWIKDE